MTYLTFAGSGTEPLPDEVYIEIRRPSLALVARTTASRGAEVAPGTYHVIARLPGGTQLETWVEAVGDVARVQLVPDPGEAIAGSWGAPGAANEVELEVLGADRDEESLWLRFLA